MVINQLAANGDLIYLEPMYRHFWEKNGVKPIVPVRDHLLWLSEYIESADFRKMSEFQLDYESMEVTEDYLPARYANQIYRKHPKYHHDDYENCMPDKYLLAWLNPEIWKGIKINWNLKRSAELMVDLGLNDYTDYIVVNEYCQIGQIKINVKAPSGTRIVHMHQLPKYTLLDWFFVLCFAKEIHTVSTSVFYILQSMGYEGKAFIYPRPQPDGLRGISKLIPTFDCTYLFEDKTGYIIHR